MSLPLEGRTAVVTGAGRGLGRAEALELARLGAAVVVNDFGQPGRDGSGAASAAPAEEVVAEIRAAGGRAVAHTGDVADHEQARDLVESAVAEFGRLDVLVNNAGILRDRMVFSMTEDEWDSVIRVHLKGHFNTTRFASAYWRARSKAADAPVYGRIVNTSSEAFLAGSAGQPNYAAAKGGIVGLTTSTALALAKYGVTANVICPRARTRMTADVFAGVPRRAGRAASGVRTGGEGGAEKAGGAEGTGGTGGAGDRDGTGPDGTGGANGTGPDRTGGADGTGDTDGTGPTGAGGAGAVGRRLDPLAPEHVAPLVGYLASPAAGRVTGQLLVVHGGMVAVVDRPRVAAKFDTGQDVFTYDELDGLLTPHYADRPAGETFAATEVLGLTHASLTQR